MLKIKIASVLVVSTLLLGGCASKSPVNINDVSKNNTTASQEVAKTNEVPSQPTENNTQAQQTVQTPQEETKKVEVQTQNKATTNNTQSTTTTQKPVTQTTTRPSNNVQASTYSKPTQNTQPAQSSPTVVSQNGVEYLAAVEDEVLRLCNVERSKAGLSPLVMASNVREAARFKAQEMLTKNYFDHNSPYTGSPFDLMRSRGIQFGYGGENIQMSQGKDKATITAQYLVTNWMNSPGHRANILKPEFKKMGVGVAFSADGNKAYESQLFTD